MCLKVRLSKKEAAAVIKLSPKIGKQYRKEKRAYYCANCNAWHLTSHESPLEKIEPTKLTLLKKWQQILKAKN